MITSGKSGMSRALIILGLVIAAVGLLWPWIGRLGLGRLPGDIFIQRQGFTFYAPITTGILVSAVLSLSLEGGFGDGDLDHGRFRLPLIATTLESASPDKNDAHRSITGLLRSSMSDLL
jgi:hypothetical protein